MNRIQCMKMNNRAGAGREQSMNRVMSSARGARECKLGERCARRGKASGTRIESGWARAGQLLRSSALSAAAARTRRRSPADCAHAHGHAHRRGAAHGAKRGSQAGMSRRWRTGIAYVRSRRCRNGGRRCHIHRRGGLCPEDDCASGRSEGVCLAPPRREQLSDEHQCTANDTQASHGGKTHTQRACQRQRRSGTGEQRARAVQACGKRRRRKEAARVNEERGARQARG